MTYMLHVRFFFIICLSFSLTRGLCQRYQSSPNGGDNQLEGTWVNDSLNASFQHLVGSYRFSAWSYPVRSLSMSRNGKSGLFLFRIETEFEHSASYLFKLSKTTSSDLQIKYIFSSADAKIEDVIVKFNKVNGSIDVEGIVGIRNFTKLKFGNSRKGEVLYGYLNNYLTGNYRAVNCKNKIVSPIVTIKGNKIKGLEGYVKIETGDPLELLKDNEGNLYFPVDLQQKDGSKNELAFRCDHKTISFFVFQKQEDKKSIKVTATAFCLAKVD